MSLNTTLMIGDVNKAMLLAAMYNNAKIFNQNAVVHMTNGMAQEILKSQNAFRNYKGKTLWIDLSRNDKMNVYWYDHKNGLGQGRAMINKVRANQRMQPGRAVSNAVNMRKKASTRKDNSNMEFIPNATTPSQQGAGFMRNRGMNVIKSAATAVTVDTSKIYNPATARQNSGPKKKKVQVLIADYHRPRKVKIPPKPVVETGPETTPATPEKKKPVRTSKVRKANPPPEKDHEDEVLFEEVDMNDDEPLTGTAPIFKQRSKTKERARAKALARTQK